MLTRTIDITLVFINYQQSIKWNIDESLIKLFSFLTKFNRIHDETLFIYTNNKIFKPTQSYEELNKPLIYYTREETPVNIYISHIPNN